MKKILYVDMDGVIADFEEFVVNIDPNININETERQILIDQIMESNPNMFENLNPIENSIESVNKLREIYDIYFLSTPVWNVPESYSGKRKWIRKHFGEWADKKLILTHRKDLCIGDFLVDDRTKNGAGEFKGIHIHFGKENFENWDKVLRYLEK